MKVLNINSYYLSSTLYKSMEEHMIKKCINISTYVPLYPGYKVREEINYKPPNHVNVTFCYNKRDRFIFHCKQIKIIKNFFKIYDVNKYDLLHAHTLFSNGYIAYLTHKKFNKPYIVAVRNTDMNLFFKKMIHLRSLGIKILLNSEKIIFLSHSYREQCIKNYIPKKYKELIKSKSKVIPNGIDPFWYENKPNKLENPTNDVMKIIFVGNGSKNKNLISLVKACEIIIRERDSKINLTVVGNVSNEKLLNEINKKKYIEYKGLVSKEELLLLYRENNFFVLPSLKETFGLVYAEAMSQGLPVLYTKNQGFDKYFEDGLVGYAINSRDPNDIANKLIKINTKYKQISQRCLKFSNEFRWDYIVNDYIRLYKEILNVGQV